MAQVIESEQNGLVVVRYALNVENENWVSTISLDDQVDSMLAAEEALEQEEDFEDIEFEWYD